MFGTSVLSIRCIGAPLEWIRGEARYKSDKTGMQIYAKLKPGSEYSTSALAAKDDIVRDLGNVGNPYRVIAFVKKYGMLLHGPQQLEAEKEVQESFATW